MSQPMTYEAWRITYQSSEQAARAAYAVMQEQEKVSAQRLDEMMKLAGHGQSLGLRIMVLEGERDVLTLALKRCVRVLAGEEMTKGALIRALEGAREVLQGVGEGGAEKQRQAPQINEGGA